jgi:hypothetical protein
MKYQAILNYSMAKMEKEIELKKQLALALQLGVIGFEVYLNKCKEISNEQKTKSKNDTDTRKNVRRAA